MKPEVPAGRDEPTRQPVRHRALTNARPLRCQLGPPKGIHDAGSCLQNFDVFHMHTIFTFGECRQAGHL